MHFKGHIIVFYANFVMTNSKKFKRSIQSSTYIITQTTKRITVYRISCNIHKTLQHFRHFFVVRYGVGQSDPCSWCLYCLVLFCFFTLLLQNTHAVPDRPSTIFLHTSICQSYRDMCKYLGILAINNNARQRTLWWI